MLKKNGFLKIVIIVGIISFGFGIIYYSFLSNEYQNLIVENIKLHKIFAPNFILKDLCGFSIILVTSFFLIGPFINIFLLLYELFSFGFLIAIFSSIYHLNGIIYILIYFLVCRFLSILFLLILLRKTTKISTCIFKRTITKNDSSSTQKIISSIRICLYLIVFIFIYNILVYFLAPYILKSLQFLLV